MAITYDKIGIDKAKNFIHSSQKSMESVNEILRSIDYPDDFKYTTQLKSGLLTVIIDKLTNLDKKISRSD